MLFSYGKTSKVSSQADSIIKCSFVLSNKISKALFGLILTSYNYFFYFFKKKNHQTGCFEFQLIDFGHFRSTSKSDSDIHATNRFRNPIHLENAKNLQKQETVAWALWPIRKHHSVVVKVLMWCCRIPFSRKNTPLFIPWHNNGCLISDCLGVKILSHAHGGARKTRKSGRGEISACNLEAKLLLCVLSRRRRTGCFPTSLTHPRSRHFCVIIVIARRARQIDQRIQKWRWNDNKGLLSKCREGGEERRVVCVHTLQRTPLYIKNCLLMHGPLADEFLLARR